MTSMASPSICRRERTCSDRGMLVGAAIGKPLYSRPPNGGSALPDTGATSSVGRDVLASRALVFDRPDSRFSRTRE